MHSNMDVKLLDMRETFTSTDHVAILYPYNRLWWHRHTHIQNMTSCNPAQEHMLFYTSNCHSCYFFSWVNMTTSNILWEQMVVVAAPPHTFCSSQTMFFNLCSNPSEDSVTFTQLFCHFLCASCIAQIIIPHPHNIFGYFQLLAQFLKGAKSLICNFTPFINSFWY